MPKFAISESIVISAPIADVSARLSDFKDWKAWSPWLMAEPECPLEYGGDGSWYAWNGDIVGSGKMTRLSDDGQVSKYDLQFYKPWKSQADVEFRLAETQEGTKVTWSMSSALPFFMFWMKKKMAAFIAADYKRGLANLKDHIELGAVPSQLAFPGTETVDSLRYVGVQHSVAMATIGPTMKADFDKLGAWATESGAEVQGAFCIYTNWDVVNQMVDYTAALQVGAEPQSLPDGLRFDTLPGGKAYRVRHTGPYRHLGNGWAAGMMRSQAKQFKTDKSRAPLERYVTDPTQADDDAAIITDILLPSK